MLWRRNLLGNRKHVDLRGRQVGRLVCSVVEIDLRLSDIISPGCQLSDNINSNFLLVQDLVPVAPVLRSACVSLMAFVYWLCNVRFL